MAHVYCATPFLARQEEEDRKKERKKEIKIPECHEEEKGKVHVSITDIRSIS